MKAIIFRLILVLFPFILFGIIGEIWLRVAASRGNQKNAAAWAAMLKEQPALLDGAAQLRDLLRPDPNPKIIYRLRPDLEVEFMGADLTTNEDGFRGLGFSGSPGAIHLLALGDSCLFGWGVGDDETYLHRVIQILNESSAMGRTWEGLNTGVPGYNTVMEVELLRQHVADCRPDLVLIHFVNNDLRLPRFMAVERSGTHSHLLRWIKDRSGMRAPGGSDFYDRHPDDVPEAYADMVGEGAYVHAMNGLKAMSAEHNFRLLLVCNSWPPDYVRETVKRLQIPMFTIGEVMHAYMRQNDIKQLAGSPLTVSATDPHHSALAHRLIAEKLAPFLLEQLQLARTEK